MATSVIRCKSKEVAFLLSLALWALRKVSSHYSAWAWSTEPGMCPGYFQVWPLKPNRRGRSVFWQTTSVRMKHIVRGEIRRWMGRNIEPVGSTRRWVAWLLLKLQPLRPLLGFLWASFSGILAVAETSLFSDPFECVPSFHSHSAFPSLFTH